MKQSIQIIDNDGIIINCFQTANSTIKNSTFINRRINKLREFFKQDVIKYLNLNNSFIYELYFYESASNNAFAAKHSDGYVIAFTTAFLIRSNFNNRWSCLDQNMGFEFIELPSLPLNIFFQKIFLEVFFILIPSDELDFRI